VCKMAQGSTSRSELAEYTEGQLPFERPGALPPPHVRLCRPRRYAIEREEERDRPLQWRGGGRGSRRLHSDRGLVTCFIDPLQIIVYEDRAVADRSFLGVRQRACTHSTGHEIYSITVGLSIGLTWIGHGHETASAA
jgi:hypothetical protein